MKSPGFAERLSLTKLVTAVVSLLLILFIKSCTTPGEKQTQTVPGDEEITRTIHTKIAEEAQVDTTLISVETNEGIVTISGETDNLLAKQKVNKIAESTFGVLSVVNNVKIVTQRPDRAIDRDVNQALSADPVTENWKITSDVENGKVVLTGIVDSWQEKKLVGDIVSSVKGVRDISNELLINYNATRTDQEIQNEVKRTLTMDSRINDNLVTVSVEEGKVSLSGSVGSAYEKNLAAELSHLTGVEEVVTDKLEVHPEYQSRMYRNNKIESLTSEEIKTAIRKALRYDPRVPQDSIEVSIDGSTAILRGNVENLNSKLAAGNDAQNTAGINSVQNNIRVERKVVVAPEVPTTDSAIADRIRDAITRNPYTETANIEVDVENGIVVLKGEVDSQFKKKQIEEVAENIKGVIAMSNNLHIRNRTND